jgi:hypothetical protein
VADNDVKVLGIVTIDEPVDEISSSEERCR